jgi:hypothetical protein
MSRSTRRTLSAVAGAAIAALALLHALLFWGRVADGSLLKPEVAARWGSALALLAAMRALQRHRIPLFHGRRALVLWCLIAMLHASADVDRARAAGDAPSIVPPTLTLVIALLAAGLAGAAPSLRGAAPTFSPVSRRSPRVLRSTALLGPRFSRPPPPLHATPAFAG